MALILIQKDPANLIQKDVSASERTAWAQDFTIYDVNADGSRGPAVGPTRARSDEGPLYVDSLGAVRRGPDGAESPVSGGEVATWADLPAANTVTVGRTYTVLADGSKWWSDGARWRPVNGHWVAAQRCGSLAAPIATFTGAAAGDFVLPAVPTTPAGMLFAGASVRLEGMVRRTSAVSSAGLQVRFGTAGNSTDSLVLNLTLGAVANQDVRFDVVAVVTGAAGYTTSNWAAVSGSSAGPFTDRSTNINVGAPMLMSIGFASASASDSFSLLHYCLTVRA